MLRWRELAGREPALAAAGQERLFQFGPGVAFLATVRKDGGAPAYTLLNSLLSIVSE